MKFIKIVNIRIIGVLTILTLLAIVSKYPTANATFPGANGKIAFMSDRDGNAEIYSGQTNLTNNPANDTMPAWSADGTKIAFASDRDGNYEIYVMNADGSGQTNLTNNPSNDEEPTWSPDGMKIAFRRNVAFGIAQIYVIDVNTLVETPLTNDSVLNNAPDWSPDGIKIAFAKGFLSGGDSEVYVMNSADGSGQTNLSNNHFIPDQDGSPSWSPDGTKLLFGRGGSGWSGFGVMNSADGSGQTMINTNQFVGDGLASWSPDGTKIVFISQRDNIIPEIYVMNADGSGTTRLTNNSAFDYYPDWQPIPPVCVQPPSGLTNWWPGDGNANDIQGSNDGILQNGATFTTGKVEQTFHLDGTDDFISMSNFQFPTSLTIDAWIRPDRLENEMIIATNPAGGYPYNQNTFFLWHGPTGTQLRYNVDPDAYNRGYWYVVYPFVQGNWYHVAVTQSGPASLPEFYINGVQYPAVVDFVIGSPFRTTASLSIGRQGDHDGGYFKGSIDEVEVFNRVLSTNEIQTIYNAGVAGKCKPTTVAIDIKPGSDPNCFNSDGHGAIPVAILGSGSFDATQIDPATVSLNGQAVKAVGKSDKLLAHTEDTNNDGYTDLVVQIQDSDAIYQIGNTSATLTGNTYSGQQIQGTDDICIVQ